MSKLDDLIHAIHVLEANSEDPSVEEYARACLPVLEDREAEAWKVAAARRSEARRYYVAWQVARMRAADFRRMLAELGVT